LSAKTPHAVEVGALEQGVVRLVSPNAALTRLEALS
jgi:hypothetical protein